ncbi:hypothetical protein COBT_004209, partial [Conglomerata obtusa]
MKYICAVFIVYLAYCCLTDENANGGNENQVDAATQTKNKEKDVSEQANPQKKDEKKNDGKGEKKDDGGEKKDGKQELEQGEKKDDGGEKKDGKQELEQGEKKGEKK